MIWAVCVPSPKTVCVPVFHSGQALQGAAASRSFGLITAGTAVTLDLCTQFIGAGRIDEPLDAVVELLRETGRLLFLRGLIVQGDETIASFTATIRKPSPQK